MSFSEKKPGSAQSGKIPWVAICGICTIASTSVGVAEKYIMENDQRYASKSDFAALTQNVIDMREQLKDIALNQREAMKARDICDQSTAEKSTSVYKKRKDRTEDRSLMSGVDSSTSNQGQVGVRYTYLK